MSVTENITQQALALPPADRAFLADQLEASLTESDSNSDEIALALSAEVDRRLTAYDSGKLQALDMVDSMQSARERLDRYCEG